MNDTLADPLRVDLFYSSDGGTSFPPAFGVLAGDVGSGVIKGTGNSIVWTNFAADLAPLGGRQVIFRVLARREGSVFAVQFVDDSTSASEGQGTYLARLHCSLPFTGSVKYHIAQMSNVV